MAQKQSKQIVKINNTKHQRKYLQLHCVHPAHINRLGGHKKSMSFPYEGRWQYSSDGRVVRTSVFGAVDSGLIPSRVKPMTLKLEFTASLLDAGPVLGRFDQIGPRTLRGPALVGVPFCTVRYKIRESAKS